MQIVIDILEEEYQTYINHTEAILDSSIPLVHQDLLRAVINGTPLPKGHGRLIDADELYRQEKEEWLCPNNAPFIYTDYARVFAEIDNAPTIIEADKAGEEE